MEKTVFMLQGQPRSSGGLWSLSIQINRRPHHFSIWPWVWCRRLVHYEWMVCWGENAFDEEMNESNCNIIDWYSVSCPTRLLWRHLAFIQEIICICWKVIGCSHTPHRWWWLSARAPLSTPLSRWRNSCWKQSVCARPSNNMAGATFLQGIIRESVLRGTNCVYGGHIYYARMSVILDSAKVGYSEQDWLMYASTSLQWRLLDHFRCCPQLAKLTEEGKAEEWMHKPEYKPLKWQLEAKKELKAVGQ